MISMETGSDLGYFYGLNVLCIQGLCRYKDLCL